MEAREAASEAAREATKRLESGGQRGQRESFQAVKWDWIAPEPLYTLDLPQCATPLHGFARREWEPPEPQDCIKAGGKC